MLAGKNQRGPKDFARRASRAEKFPRKSSPPYYNIEVMLRGVAKRGGEVGVCGTGMDARGIVDSELSDATHRSSLDQLTEWTQWADKALVF
jgi:uncharacterized protein involved in oxidation of intracellular sulfur